jgi:peptidoglycan/LPS O-acetylase OafA/YrhL
METGGFARRWETMNRIRTLDGWRGVAILLVIAEHAGWERFEHHLWAGLGSLGVDIFFVLSGFIITTRLLQEKEANATVSLSSFYIRRVFRILPVVGCYLAVLCLLSIHFNLDLRFSQLMGSVFFFRNYQYAAQPTGIYTAQFWSLSIEEHFYLLWPLLLLRFGKRSLVWIAGAGAFLCGMWRLYDITHPDSLVGRWLPGAQTGLRTLRTDARLDGLLLGCALAILLTRTEIRNWISRNFPKETPLFAAALLVVNEQRVNACAAFTDYLLITLMVASTLVVEEGLAHKWLNSRLLVAIGSISYSLYVWQQIFLLHPKGTHPLGIVADLPWNVVGAVLAAILSYRFIEQPSARLAKRFASRKLAKAALATVSPQQVIAT